MKFAHAGNATVALRSSDWSVITWFALESMIIGKAMKSAIDPKGESRYYSSSKTLQERSSCLILKRFPTQTGSID
jgi:hypothetical protein